MYGQDSFFTLSIPGQIGLACLSLVLFAAVIGVSWRLAKCRSMWVRLGVPFLLFWLFVWVSPQVYYTYYRMIFDGLPAQWVIGVPPGLGHIIRLLTFTAQSNLSAHGQGILGWVAILVSLARAVRWRA